MKSTTNFHRSDVNGAIQWPEGKRFAFTVVDDTDCATVGNVKPVYDCLAEHGLRTTKTVWPLRARRDPHWKFGSLEEPAYLEWIRSLHEQGFEIAVHGASDEPCRRADVRRALDYFREVLGRDPRMHVNHVGQEELVYWYEERLHGLARQLYKLANAMKRRSQHSSNLGHVDGSEYFWGDLCRERIEYVRNLTFLNINTLSQDPYMPYHDPERPYVNYWYSASEGTNLRRFCEQISERNQDRLAEERGACILYTHFAFGFVDDEGKLDGRFQKMISRLATLGGWFVPVSELLDFLRQRPGWRKTPNGAALQRTELKWLIEKLRTGTK
jgi:hypothetical protein